MNETTATDELIAEYGEWLKRESSVRNVGEWREVTLPFLDRSNDDLCFYVRTTDGVTSFTDDGYTMASFDLNGVTITESRRERINRLALRFGAMVGDDGQITLETEGSRPDAMNRFVQALTDIGSMLETSQKRVLSYFADDVALKLDSCQVFYTPNVGIRGVSSYEHSFDFLFQRSANHPTRFCQAPNRFDKDAVAARRAHRVPQLRCDRHPLLQIGREGSRGTRRVASGPYKDSSRRLTASAGAFLRLRGFVDDLDIDDIHVIMQVGDGLAEEFGEAGRVPVGVVVGHADAGVAHDGGPGIVGHVGPGGHAGGPVACAVDGDRREAGGLQGLVPVVAFGGAAHGVAS